MNLKEALNEETVGRLPLRKAIAIKPETLIRDAVSEMRTNELGCAVIVDANNHPVGLFTERGVIGALVKGAPLDSTQAQEFAEPSFVNVKTSDTIANVWFAILRDSCRFVSVTDDDGRLVGLTGQRGLAEYVSEYYPRQVMVQRLGEKPWMQQREGA